jgi:predicted MFS family arabinose efflux permease
MDWTYIYLIIAVLCVIVLILGVIRIRKDREGEVYQAQHVDD